MKKGWLIIIALLVTTAMFANSVTLAPRRTNAQTSNRYEVVHWSENFESGATGWVHYDGAVSPSQWHVYNAGGTQGNVWWMGDPNLAQGANIGGYHDNQYLVLDTPARTVSAANTNLTFKMRYNVEDPAGATAPYNGWDAINVRVSTNNGQTWTPITGTPAYNMTSSYAFGFQHNEGPNIPGWGGVLTTWTNCTFNLSSYVGQNVKIRFAFASDPAYATGDAPAMFGVMIDDIAFADYTNGGVADGQMTWNSLVPLGGDLWHIAAQADAPSPTNVMRNQNASGSYNPNMMNYLVSPPIQLPASGDIRADFMIKGLFTDANTFPEVDYFGWEITVNDGVTWFAMSNPYGTPGGMNYVYSDAPDMWASMTESYSLDGFISDYSGQTIKLRWFFRSDADAPNGTGIMIDDVVIYNDVYIAAPTNLQATATGSSVVLNWSAPGGGGGGEPGWLHYDSGENSDSIGTGAAADFDVAAKWDPAGTYGIDPWVGMNITKIKFWPNEVNCQYAVRVWTGSANNLVVDQAVTSPVNNAWNEIVLTTPFTIPAGTRVMAGYRCNTTAGYPAGVDAGPQVEGYGNMMRFQGNWTTLSALAPTLTYNWNIQVYVEDAAGREYILGQLPQNDQFATGTLASTGTSRQDRDVTAYKVYRNEVFVAEVAGTVLTYTDTNVAGGLQTYTVTAMYGTNESEPSNAATVFVTPTGYAELNHDDGSASMGYSVGATKQMAVKYAHTNPVYVRYAKVFVHTVNTAGIIIRVWDTTGANGMPGTQLIQFQYPAASVVQGWNYIALPDVLVPSGQFYIGLLETTNACLIGLDNSSTGNSYKRITTNWEPVTEGEVMIRAIVENTSDNDDNVVPTLALTANNYPNPFNPETTISYTLPRSGNASVRVYNMKGQVVRTLINDAHSAGNHTVVWNGMDESGNAVSSGLYFYQVSANGQSITKKMLLAK